MSVFNEDRATMNQAAADLDGKLSQCGLDAVLHSAFDEGMNMDEIMYVIFSHTERIIKRYTVQAQLKKAANKDKK